VVAKSADLAGHGADGRSGRFLTRAPQLEPENALFQQNLKRLSEEPAQAHK
jgi:hypothetical protein